MFADPITSAAGYDKFAAQWYGLAALFQPIRIQSHEVISGGNPLELDLTNKYVLKGLQKEQVMSSHVKIHVDADGKIEKLEDRWNDKLPDGPVSEVSLSSSPSYSFPSSFSLLGLPVPPRLRALVSTAGLWGWWAFAHASWWWPFLVRAPVVFCTPHSPPVPK